MARYRYIGDYFYTYSRGLIELFADTSAIYSHIYNQHGLPTLTVPYGASPTWYKEMNLERDIDVLWMGKIATSRRRKILSDLRKEFSKYGIKFHIADNVENPFIIGVMNVPNFLNLIQKITLNLTRSWYDATPLRFVLAAPNKSSIIFKSLLPHCPYYVPGSHYISAPHETLADVIYALS